VEIRKIEDIEEIEKIIQKAIVYVPGF